MPDRDETSRQMAAALDAVLDDIQQGRPVDRAALLARFPSLADALAALDHLFAPPATPDALLAQPQAIGPYQIERELGAGGFGVVYLAFDPDVRRRVAVKILHPGRLDQPDVVFRFQREVRIIGKLRHPGIVQLYDYSRQGPPWFLVTEFVEGVDPRDWCRQRQATSLEIADLVATIADAVDYAHQEGVWHRDLKPGNILVDAAGLPHVLDFGLARLQMNEGATLTAPTLEGHILGSLPYMPPEQASGQSHTADARSDVYSLGVILYELLTGQLPFQGPAHSLPARVLEEAVPSPRLHVPGLHPDLEAICLKALCKNPRDRYTTAGEMARDLRAFREGKATAARPLTLVGRIFRVLNRRHLDTLRRGWTVLLLLLGATIFTGCAICNHWEMTLSSRHAWWAILATKIAQVALMLLLAVKLRPLQDDPSRHQTPMSPAERQIWSLVPGYYGSFLTLLAVSRLLPQPVPLAPILAILSGMGFATLGATIWGWFYVWAVAFFLLAGLITLASPYGLTLLGLGWFLCLVVGSIHLHWTR